MPKLKRNFVPLSSIYIPPEKDDRIRDPDNLAKAVKERIKSFTRFGQLQPILVEELDPPINGAVWKLIDGQVRWVAMSTLSFQQEQGDDEINSLFIRWGMRPGYIEVTTRDTQEPVVALMMEFHANEDRDDFTWKEKGKYIRRIHDMLIEKHGHKEWKAKHTAEYIGQSEATVSQYLQLTDEADPAALSPKVDKATTKGAAIKQLKIARERKRRETRAKQVEVRPNAKDFNKTAELSIYHGDCREWIKKIPDNSLDWFHWDPPYGGSEGTGGAFSQYEPIETEHDYALTLMEQMFEEIWRALSDGSWIVVWYTPVHYHRIRYLLQGHRFDSVSGRCLFCNRHHLTDHAWLSSNYSCRPAPHRFWVNPYPNLWRKTNRSADGHEIQRFFTKETEPFFLAGKQDERTPILLRSDRGNVFDFESLPQHSTDRRHVHHKPVPLLKEILSCISVPGALGGDAGAGSGSIIEAAYESGRRIVVAELNEDYHKTCLTVGREIFKDRNYGPESIASWLETKFTG